MINRTSKISKYLLVLLTEESIKVRKKKYIEFYKTFTCPARKFALHVKHVQRFFSLGYKYNIVHNR